MNVSLPHQARRVDPFAARDQQSEPFRRARDEEVVVDVGDAPGRATVTVGDGDPHDVVLVEDGEGHVGYCDCDGFAFHDDLEGGCCAHLVALAMESTLNQGLIRTLDDVLEVDDLSDEPDDAAEAIAEETGEDPENYRSDAEMPDPDDLVDVDPDANASEEASAELPDRDDRAEDVEDLDEFVTDVAGVPSVFVVDMGRGDEPNPYVTKAGLNYVADRRGIETRAEPVTPSWEGDEDLSVFKGVAIDGEGRRFEDFAKVRTGDVERTVGKENLDEMASTKATNRALRLATGCGFGSVEEVDESRSFEAHDVSRDPDVIDVDQEDVATDGGR
jgi:predicted nucleic acid-binding Zn finger protein